MNLSSRIPRFIYLGLVVSLALVARAADAWSFPRSAPEAQGVSSAGLLKFVEDAEKKIDALHSVVIVRHGQVVAEGWWAPYAAETRHSMFSLSKSFTSTAVGLAVEEGKLKVTDTVLSFFPDEAPEKPSANLKAMRVRDLLTMSTGHHNEDIATFPFPSDENLVKKFLAIPVTHKPGTFFVYNTPATYMLSAIVQKVTGQTVLDYLRPRLFEPLGITNPVWDASKQGVSFGGFGLSIRTEDIARLGQLYLQKGKWNGKQLVPAAWVEAATARQMSNGSAPDSDWEQGYGYQFWRCRHGAFRGDGAHGQFCIVLPELDTVVAITSGTRDLQGVVNVVWDSLLPAIQGATLAADKAGQAALKARLAGLSLKMPEGVATNEAAKGVTGKRYAIAKNALGIEAITLLAGDTSGGPGGPGEREIAALVRMGGADQRVAIGSGTWRKGTLAVGPAGAATPDAVATSGAWTSADTLTFKVARRETPFIMTFRLKFAGDAVELEVEQNVGPATARVKVAGKAE